MLKEYKNKETKNNLQNFFDYCIRQIELSIREIGYGDATINKKMKEYVNLLFSVIDKIDLWEDMDNEKKIEIIKLFIEDGLNFYYFLNYLEKYRFFLSKNTFNSLSKEILTLKILIMAVPKRKTTKSRAGKGVAFKIKRKECY